MDTSDRRIGLEVCAVTITYNPDLDIFRSQVDSLRNQCALIVVDNGSDRNKLEDIQAIVDEHPCAHLVSLDKNFGIAAAQNKGIACSISMGWNISYFLTLDHDSVPGSDFVKRLLKAAQILQDNNIRVAAIGPVLFDPRSKSRLKLHRIKGAMWQKVTPDPLGGSIAVASVNSSGSLISASALEDCGEFDESLFIDHVETEWCFRALDKGWKIYIDQTTEMDHRMGDDVVKYWLAGWREMPYRSPTRHYYIIRNSIALLKKPYVPLVWKFWCLLKILFTGLYFGLISSDSQNHRRQITKGLNDGWVGRTGKLNLIQ